MVVDRGLVRVSAGFWLGYMAPPPIVSGAPLADPRFCRLERSESWSSELPKMLRLMPHLRPKYCREGRMVGRQAEIMPADTSMAVQPTVGARVYVGSWLL